MHDIEQLIEQGYALSKGANTDSINAKLFPARLRPQFNHIVAKYHHTGSLNDSEIHFLVVYTTTPLEQLLELAWLEGKFYKFSSYKHKNYNLRRKYGGKYVKRIKNFNRVR